MIDPQQIEQLLQNTKINSLTDVISFILENIHKVLNFEPIQQINYRLSELEKPKGLDRVMIEEVKTLIQAISQQRQEDLKKDIEKMINSMEYNDPDQTRRSIQENDILTILNTNQLARKHPSNFTTENRPNNMDSIYKQINEIRALLERKGDRKDIMEIRNCVHKEISSKMSIKQTERILQRFQKEVFAKLNQSHSIFQKMEMGLKKMMKEELLTMKQQLNENHQTQDYKTIATKFQKKLKKVSESKQLQIKSIDQRIQKTKKQSYNQFQQICQLIQAITNNGTNSCVWLAHEDFLKTKLIPWTKQQSNCNKQNYQLSTNRTQITVQSPGYYRIECLVIGTETNPVLVLNSDTKKLKIEQKNSQSYSLETILLLHEHKNMVSIRCQSFTSALIKIWKY